MEDHPIDQFDREVEMNESSGFKNVVALIGFLVFLFGGSLFLWKQSPVDNLPIKFPFNQSESDELKSFSSEEEFLAYIQEGSDSGSDGFFGNVRTLEMAPMMDGSVDMMVKNESMEDSGATRVSETNVQVMGIDEPDIVKTDGENIYSSLNTPIYRIMPEPMPVMPMFMELDETGSSSIAPRDIVEPSTSIISAFPPANLEKIADIEKQGNLLLDDEVLMVFGSDEVVAYDVSSPSEPEEVWDIQIGDNTLIQNTRMLDGDVYIITRTYVDYDHPCPISPLSPVGGLTIPCDRIFYPTNPIQTDSTYSVMKVDAQTGKVSDSISFVGSTQSSVVYMSENSLYVTYTTYGDYSQFMYEFFSSLGSGLLSSEANEKLKKLASYDISSQSKLIEIQTILENYYKSISKDERRRVENEIQNKISDFAQEKMREMEKTGLVKISLDELSIVSSGSVPGHPLNQFSLDEYEGNLRIATTVGGRGLVGSESANDVYVLDKDMKVVGSVIDLGLDERIYSARFIGEMGYVVTFRETDPFYVLDLSNPNKPEMKGELKIPGFSSYLHPISKDLILGVGREDNNVKLSLFDVSDPGDPREVDKYSLDAYWSDVSNTHHAFLQDEKHEIFFLPAGQDGYIFSYENEEISLTKVVSDANAKRAIFLDDYLYVVGETKLVVLNESDWERVNSLEY